MKAVHVLSAVAVSAATIVVGIGCGSSNQAQVPPQLIAPPSLTAGIGNVGVTPAGVLVTNTLGQTIYTYPGVLTNYAYSSSIFMAEYGNELVAINADGQTIIEPTLVDPAVVFNASANIAAIAYQSQPGLYSFVAVNAVGQPLFSYPPIEAVNPQLYVTDNIFAVQYTMGEPRVLAYNAFGTQLISNDTPFLGGSLQVSNSAIVVSYRDDQGARVLALSAEGKSLLNGDPGAYRDARFTLSDDRLVVDGGPGGHQEIPITGRGSEGPRPEPVGPAPRGGEPRPGNPPVFGGGNGGSRGNAPAPGPVDPRRPVAPHQR